MLTETGTFTFNDHIARQLGKLGTSHLLLSNILLCSHVTCDACVYAVHVRME